MAFPVFLDTCVLYPQNLCDLLLRVAESGVFRPHWSADVLEELERNLSRAVPDAGDGARRRVSAMARAFPEADVEGYESLVDGMACDPKDRHVLAAAVHAGCQVIVTSNLKDFPAEALTPYSVVAVAPDDFMLDQLDLYPRQTLGALVGMSRSSSRPPLTPIQLLGSLARSGLPRFCAEVRRKSPDIGAWPN